MLHIAIKVASEAHLLYSDKSGRPYILHPLYVMDKVIHLGDDYASVGILHDVVEDTDVTLSDLKLMGFSETVLDALSLLTHAKGTSYDSYIKALATNEIATRVKLADLTHNSDLTRLKGLTEKDFRRMEKYSRAFVFLTETLEKF